jgi:hypothetical protein
MPYGIRIWDASGNLTLDVTDRITRWNNTITLAANSIPINSFVDFSVPGVTLDGTWFISAAFNTTSSLSGLMDIRITFLTNVVRFTNLSTIQTRPTAACVVDVIRG